MQYFRFAMWPTPPSHLCSSSVRLPTHHHRHVCVQYFRFAGRFVGKALADGVQLSCHFTRAFYKHMLDIPLGLPDLEDTDPDYYKNLQARAHAGAVCELAAQL